MIEGLGGSCQLTGFVPQHAMAVAQVADRFNCVIMFREPGIAAQRLIAEGYGMKGFRIDTKSCTWGPMSGFVCMDPRLSKPKDGGSNTAFNTKYTKEALSGHVGDSFVAPTGQDALDWVADVMPIVISRARINELKLPGRRLGDGSLVGETTMAFKDGAVTLPWRLIPLNNASQPWARPASFLASRDYHVLCVDTGGSVAFKQIYSGKVQPIMFRGYETILGLTNPGTKDTRGFFACVTADYDLFAIMPSVKDVMSGMHNVMAQINLIKAPLPGNVPRLPGVDDRLRTAKTGPNARFEHHKHGDVSARIMAIKTALNGAIAGAVEGATPGGGYLGGNAVHHNDEAGNEFLAKANLAECLPVICFLPIAEKGKPARQQVITIQTPGDFKVFYETYLKGQFVYKGKKAWAQSAGANLTEADAQAGF